MSLIRSVEWLANERYLAATAAFSHNASFPSIFHLLPFLYFARWFSRESLLPRPLSSRPFFRFLHPRFFVHIHSLARAFSRGREKDGCIGCPRTDDVNGQGMILICRIYDSKKYVGKKGIKLFWFGLENIENDGIINKPEERYIIFLIPLGNND